MQDLERTFSVEMKSKTCVKNISLSDDSRSRVVFEGSLGKPRGAVLAEGDVLEIIGENGVLRVNLSESELKQVLKKYCESDLSSQVGSYTNSTQMR